MKPLADLALDPLIHLILAAALVAGWRGMPDPESLYDRPIAVGRVRR